MPAATAARYAAEVAALAGAISAYRRAEPGREGRTSNNNGVSIECGCGRKIRASRAVAEAGPILCGLCGEPFTAPEVDED